MTGNWVKRQDVVIENLFKKYRIEEKNGWQDYFRLDHPESEIESIRKTLSVL